MVSKKAKKMNTFDYADALSPHHPTANQAGGTEQITRKIILVTHLIRKPGPNTYGVSTEVLRLGVFRPWSKRNRFEKSKIQIQF
jgi:hypothetical protein